MTLPFIELLQEFGPPRKAYHPEYSFWFLRSEGIWEVEPATGWITKKGGSSPAKADRGRLTDCLTLPSRPESE
jgi:hypothetical protein